MVISRDADNGFLALITFSAEDTDTDTDTDTGNLHTRPMGGGTFVSQKYHRLFPGLLNLISMMPIHSDKSNLEKLIITQHFFFKGVPSA